MIQYIYVSSSVKRFSNEELLKLLEKARANNERTGISGMLLYKDGDFMQALEGPEEAVHRLSARIAGDPRHTNVKKLLEAPITAREFPDWSMGFQNLDGMETGGLPGYSTFLDSPLREESFAGAPTLARQFLLLFKSKTVVEANAKVRV
jgi:FAD-dependent sensor of blue light